MTASVDILLSVYNGAAYVEELLSSLDAQTFTDWRLLVRDDGSSDDTLERVRRFSAARWPQRLLEVPGGEPLGVCHSFGALLERADAPYAMFCDQDDVWLPGKIERTLAAMRRAEGESRAETPILVHTDLKVVDAGLKPIAESFWAYERLDPKRGAALNRLLVRNVVTGCTVIMNRALRERIGRLPSEAVMHDQWAALAATAFGKIVSLECKPILYRQHGGNEVGSKPYGFLTKLTSNLNPIKTREKLRRGIAQARKFLELYGSDLPPRAWAIVESYSRLAQDGFIDKRLRLFREGFSKGSLLMDAGLYALI